MAETREQYIARRAREMIDSGEARERGRSEVRAANQRYDSSVPFYLKPLKWAAHVAHPIENSDSVLGNLVNVAALPVLGGLGVAAGLAGTGAAAGTAATGTTAAGTAAAPAAALGTGPLTSQMPSLTAGLSTAATAAPSVAAAAAPAAKGLLTRMLTHPLGKFATDIAVLKLIQGLGPKAPEPSIPQSPEQIAGDYTAMYDALEPLSDRRYNKWTSRYDQSADEILGTGEKSQSRRLLEQVLRRNAQETDPATREARKGLDFSRPRKYLNEGSSY